MRVCVDVVITCTDVRCKGEHAVVKAMEAV